MKKIILAFVFIASCGTYIPPEEPENTEPIFDYTPPPDYSVILPDGSKGYSFKCYDLPGCYKQSGALCPGGYFVYDGETEKRLDTVRTGDSIQVGGGVASAESDGFFVDLAQVFAGSSSSVETETQQVSNAKFITIKCKEVEGSKIAEPVVRFTVSEVSQIFIDGKFYGMVGDVPKEVILVVGEHKIKTVSKVGTKEFVLVVVPGMNSDINIDMFDVKQKSVEEGWKVK